jgi:hypothetical protein
MATTEAAGTILDVVEAQLVECQPEAPPLSVDVSAVPLEASPVRQAMAATIEQTGADPPPAEAL